MRQWTVAAIHRYQVHLSPLKGFRCAYAAHTGRCGCSEIGARAIRRFGVVAGLLVLRRRMFLCGVMHRRSLSAIRPLGRRHHQAGFVDLDCAAPVDVSCCDPPDVISCCDVGSCDWPERKKKRNQNREQYVYIPPNSMRRAAPRGRS
jgi:uncharacterized protein